MSSLARPDGVDWGMTAWTVLNAYTSHVCAGGGEVIPRGGSYVRAVAFSGHDVLGGDRPRMMPLCLSCARDHGRPLPPTWSERRAETALGRHHFVPGERGSQRCAVHMPGRGQRDRCGLMWHNPVHRFYPCGHCEQGDFSSIETRDRHEADEHGGGW